MLVGGLFLLALVGTPALDGAAQSKPKDRQTTAELTGNSPRPSSPGEEADAPVAKASPALAGLNSYRIGVEDELHISVWREPQLSVGVVVRPDGMISMPLLNDVPAVGLTPMELQARLTEKLKPFVLEPQVTVIVNQIRSRKVYLIGSVGHQGAFALGGKMTVLELISEAGGLGPFAKAGSIYVLRTVNGKKVRLPFDYKDAIRGRESKKNIELLPGDIVVVP